MPTNLESDIIKGLESLALKGESMEEGASTSREKTNNPESVIQRIESSPDSGASTSDAQPIALPNGSGSGLSAASQIDGGASTSADTRTRSAESVERMDEGLRH